MFWRKSLRHGVFDLAIEAHVVVEVEILLAGKFLRLCGGFRSRHVVVLRVGGRWSGSYLKAMADGNLIRAPTKVFYLVFAVDVATGVRAGEVHMDDDWLF